MTSWKERSAIALMSAPAAKTSSLPATTMQWTPSSPSKASIAPASSSISCGESALRASGRSRRTIPTAPSCSTVTAAATLLRDQRVDPGRVAPDDHLLDLRRPLVERRDTRIAHVALDRILVDVAVPAVHLDRGIGAAHGRLRGVVL